METSGLTVRLIGGSTVTVEVAAAVHPLAFVEVTVYVVVTVGQTVIAAVVDPPGAQEYEAPDPEAESVVHPPSQMLPALALKVVVGTGLKVIEIPAVSAHAPFETITV